MRYDACIKYHKFGSRHLNDCFGRRLHAATHGLGTGKPLMVLLHGCPELWVSWKHQIKVRMPPLYDIHTDVYGSQLIIQ
jgi:hypothetical protein